MKVGEGFEFSGNDRFEIKRRIGAGGMGVVYAAFDRKHNASIALKTLRSTDEAAIIRFKREFRALHDISHPNLVNLGELIEDRAEVSRRSFTFSC